MTEGYRFLDLTFESRLRPHLIEVYLHTLGAPVQVQAAEEAAKQCEGAAAAELEAATSKLKEQVQQLQAAATKGETIAVAAEKEAANTRAQLKTNADQLCSARAEAASYKKEAMSLVDRVMQLDKSCEVMTLPKYTSPAICLPLCCAFRYPILHHVHSFSGTNPS